MSLKHWLLKPWSYLVSQARLAVLNHMFSKHSLLSCCDLIFLFYSLCFLSFHGHGQCPKVSIFCLLWVEFLEHLRNMDIVSFFCIYLIFPTAFIRNCYYSMNILNVFATVGYRCMGFTPGFLLCFVNLNICQILCNPIYSWQRYKCNSRDSCKLFYKWCWSKKASTFLRWPSVQVLTWEKETENGWKQKIKKL